jgi:2-polyprenyl-3-methyl-5-hydroxy-6-metoxy-1,4-benzoquinol methylase
MIESKLKNDYERMVPEFHKGNEVYGEHIARYMAAQEITKGKRVLDVASGSGYGTALLAKTAKHVTGVDVSEEATTYASEHYGGGNITYLTGDGISLPCADEEFDVITSFETIEHIENYKAFMDECSRVLKEDGLFLISTPNELEFAEGNHFHIHEFEHDELLKLVKKYFKYVKPYYQATWVANLIGDSSLTEKEWEQKIELLQAAPIKPKQLLYFYFLCSNRPIKESIMPLGVLGQHYSERQKVAAESKQKLTDQHIVNLEAKIVQLEQSLSTVLNSKSYKFSKKLAKLKRKH